jgi:cation diffusion facilitator family transporter
LKSNRLTKSVKVAEKSFIVQLIVGFAEVITGLFTLSVALIADGIQSFADALVSFIIWVGLHLSKKGPDKRFHFGYYQIETISSVVAALLMAVLGIVVLYESYRDFLNPQQIVNTELALIVASLAAVVSIVLLIYKRRAAKKYGSLALKTDASNSIKDVLTSVTAFIGIALSSYLHIGIMDAVAGIIISLFVFTMVYTILKEASLVLMDACLCPEILTDIKDVARSVDRVKGVSQIRMRKQGSYLIGDMHVAVDADMTVKDADKIASEVEKRVKRAFDEIIDIKVRIEPHKHSK